MDRYRIPALIDRGTWNALQQRFSERAQPTRSRLVVTSKPPRCACGTFLNGGRAACRVDATARLDVVESAILQPRKSELLSLEAVEKFCSLIREWHQRENEDREAVADLNGALQGNNVEAARAALRSLVGNIPVFQTGRQLAARLTMNPAAPDA